MDRAQWREFMATTGRERAMNLAAQISAGRLTTRNARP